MINDDVVKCPLCGGFTHVASPDLLAAINNPSLREKVESYVAELVKTPLADLAAVGAPGADIPKRDFQKDVHSWNPMVPMWRRSPKE